MVLTEVLKSYAVTTERVTANRIVTFIPLNPESLNGDTSPKSD